MHNIYSYHAKFNPDIPKNFIKKYSQKNDIVLDPFCGSGTTLLEGIKLNRNVIGVDLSPIAILNTKVKTHTYDIEKIKLLSENTLMPKFPNREIWFQEEIISTLGKLNYNINKIEEEKYKELFLLILLSMLNSCARKRKTWNLGYLADNVMPNLDRDTDPIKLFKKKVNEILKSEDILKEINVDVKCIESDIMKFDYKNVDLVVTSPPYPFAVDFIKYHRLALYWLEKDVEILSEEEVGARNKRARKNSVDEFYIEMEKIYLHVMQMVKNNGYWCMTIGDTTRNKEKISFVNWSIDLFEKNGWCLETQNFRYLKNQTMAQKRIKKEAVLVFKKGKQDKD